MKIQSLVPYPVDDIAPGETVDREDTPDVRRKIEAGLVAEVKEQPAAKEAK